MGVDDQAATDEGVDKQVEKTLEIASTSGDQLGHTGGSGIAGKADGCFCKRLHLGAQVDVVPLVRHAGRQTQHLVPAAQVEWSGQTHAHQAQRQRTQPVLKDA